MDVRPVVASRPVTRSYYRTDLGDGRSLTLFHDQRGERWYRQSA